MKLSDYLQLLKGQTSEEVQATLDAIQAILDARAAAELGASGGFGMPNGSTTEVEIDPKLLRPSSIKSPSGGGEMPPINVEDPDGVLDEVQDNHGSDTNDDGYEVDSKDVAETSEEDDDNWSPSGRRGDGDTDSDDADLEDEEEEEDEEDHDYNEDEDEDESAGEDEPEGSLDDMDVEWDGPEAKYNDSPLSIGDDEDDEDNDTSSDEEDDDFIDDEEDEDEGWPDDDEEEEEEDEEEFDFSDDEFGPEMADDTKVTQDDLVDDDEVVKNRLRRAQADRTKTLAQKTLDWGKKNNRPQELIDKLEAALKKLTDLSDKELTDMDDDAFTKLVNEIVADCDALHKVNYTPDVQSRVKQIRDDIDSGEMAAEINAEEKSNGQNGIQARKNSIRRYTPRSMSDFKINFYRAIKDQIAKVQQSSNSWGVLNRRAEDQGFLKPGTTTRELPGDKIPTVDVYIDQSGSWDEQDVENGKKAISVISDFEAKKQVAVNLYYFSNNVYPDPESARAEGGTSAWNGILDNIQQTGAQNVVLITDTDMNGQAERSGRTVAVKGHVWFIWKTADDQSPIIPKCLLGKTGSSQYALYNK